ncbi:hypothetical protein ACFPM0_07290 [Pseudonocardia sulfidoxydans]
MTERLVTERLVTERLVTERLVTTRRRRPRGAVGGAGRPVG